MSAGSSTGGKVAGRPIGRKYVETRRRTRKLAPGVVGLCLVMVLATFVFLIVPSPVAADPLKICQQCPNNPSQCQPNCSPPPPCPGPYSLYIGSGMLTITSTNASVQYWLLSTSGETSALSNLTWGPNTNYGFTALSNQGVGTTGSVTAFIDFLDPSATYYYHVHAWTSCTDSSGTHQYTGDYYGSWTQAADPSPAPFNYYIQGTVKDVNGVSAPANIFVQATCGDGGGGFGNGTKTNSAGHYSMNLLNANWCSNHGGYVVQVRNQVLNVNGGYSSQWGGRWNETFVIWAPQVVNFYLEVAPESTKAVVTTMEFSHTGYAQVGFCKGSSSSVESEADYSISGSLFGFSYSASSSTQYKDSFGSSNCVDTQGEPGFEAWGYPFVAGEIVFNAPGNRTPWIPWTQYYGPLQNPGDGNVTGAPLQDWMAEPTQETAACFDPQYDAYIYHFQVNANTNTQTFTFEVGGSVAQVSGEQFGVSLPFYLDGTLVATFGGAWGYSLTTSESNDFSVTATIAGPLPSVHYYTIAGCSASDTGMVLHIWLDSGPA